MKRFKAHYIWQHSINENNYFFKELFSPNNNSKKCDTCEVKFKNCRLEKKQNFLLHYNQVGGSRMNRQLPINILRGDPINYYSINFHQHKHFYDFYQEAVVDDFLNSVYERFLSDGEYKIQGYVEIIISQLK